MTIPSGRIASSVRTVSISDSTLLQAGGFGLQGHRIRAETRGGGGEFSMRVRVKQGLKNAMATVLPRSVASFLRGWRWNSWKGFD